RSFVSRFYHLLPLRPFPTRRSSDLEPVSSTTNRIEGGVNAPLRQMLSLHRGMRLDRRKRPVEWWLHQHTEAPVPVHTFIQPQHYDPTARSKPTIEEPIGPALYDRGLSTEEGIGIQRGWKGLSPTRHARARHTFLPITLKNTADHGHNM